MLCVFVWMLSLASLGRRVSVRKGLVGYLSVVRGRMASSSVPLKDEVEALRTAVKEQVGRDQQNRPNGQQTTYACSLLGVYNLAEWPCVVVSQHTSYLNGI